MINNIHIKPKIYIDLEYSYSVLQNRAGVAMGWLRQILQATAAQIIKI
jgi:hypothetical protein